jgi:hypothetical protein
MKTTRKAHTLKGGDTIQIDGEGHIVFDTYAADGLRTTIRTHRADDLNGRCGETHWMTVANDTEITEGK